MTGVFDKKQNFKDPFKENAEKVLDFQKRDANKMVEEAIQKTLSTPEIVKEKPPDLPSISTEDLELAEKMIFNSYAETDIISPNLNKYTFTISTLNAEEINLIDEMVFEYVKENDDRITNQMAESYKSILFVTLSYRGMNKKELCEEDGTAQLNTLKTAVMRCNELLANGDLENAEKLRIELKKKIKYRLMKIRKMSPAVIDFILDEKFKFDTKIHNIINMKGIIPKF